MKKVIVLMLVFCLAIALVACGNDETSSETATSSTTSEVSAESSEESVEESKEEIKLTTYAEFVAAEVQSEVIVETYVQAKEGWWADKCTVYTQNEEGAYLLYELPCTEEEAAKLVPGTKIRVKGFKGEYSGQIEIVEATFEILEGNYIAEATDVTALMGKDELIDKMTQLVTFKGVEIVASKDADGNDVAFLYKWNGSGNEGDDIYFNISDGETVYNGFNVRVYLSGNDSDVYKAAQALKVGDKVDITGYLYWYEGPQARIINITVVESAE